MQQGYMTEGKEDVTVGVGMGGIAAGDENPGAIIK